MLDALALDPATEHQIHQARFARIHYGESHDAVTAEFVVALDDEGPFARRTHQFAQGLAWIAIAGVVHLVGALRQFVNPLQVLLVQRSDADPDATTFQKRLIIATVRLEHGISLLLLKVHGPARAAFLGDWHLALRPARN